MVYWQKSKKKKKKILSVGLQNKVFSFHFLGLAFCKEKVYFSLNKEEKPVIVSVQSICSLCYEIEGHSWKIIRNSNHAKLLLQYCIVIFGFLFVNYLNVYSPNQEWNQTLNDVYMYWRRSKDIWTNVNRKSLLFLWHILHVNLWFFFFASKSKNMKKMSEKLSYTHHEYYYVYR